jgi:biotin carboxyl carrier protein
MPGRIIKVLVEPGQEVEKNQPVLVMESMKMEITQTSSFPGQVEEVNIKAGQHVNAGFLMVRIEPINRE